MDLIFLKIFGRNSISNVINKVGTNEEGRLVIFIF